ncbi:hypothetical protein SADUNF_Sadunf01G0093500 [Salix dunnii]|uniref:Cullin family profile domain-containing protein n=1 Tax=Salix dunnii TaxID=1413687 RepID=A0A835NAY4_9ROSI|nr:hypothetical protein SADUNF_Sadunf01G0093500 [Salix dunnii]
MGECKTFELEQGWEYMQKGITKLKGILDGSLEQFNSEDYMMLYTTIYNMCTQKPPNDYSQQLYDKYKEAFQDYINSTVLPSIREKHNEFMLRELMKRWANHKIMVRWLSRFFHYLDRYFIARRSLPPLNEVGLTCFCDLKVNSKAKDVVLDVKVQRELLVVHVNQLLEKEHSGVHSLLRDDKLDDLSRMFRLYNKVTRGLEPVSNVFKQHITAEGTTLVQQVEDAASCQVLIRKIIELHDKYMTYVTDCFQNHTLFHKAMKEAFEIFCNKTIAGSSSAEQLATFCDTILRKGGSDKLNDEAIEEMLEKVVKLLAYISDKDFFAEFYRKKLARGLLFDRSANNEHERSLLSKLKQQCGDLQLAKEHHSSFDEYIGNNPSTRPGIDLQVSVLTIGYWPSYKSSDINLPAEMARGVEVFKEFYDNKNKHRKLTWIFSLGSCHINAKFDQKPIELVVITYQACLLMLFNTSDKLSYPEIMTQSNLSNDDLPRLLHSLSCEKYKILSKEPNTKIVTQNDSFEFNHKFNDRMRRIKVPLPLVDERKKVVEDVHKDRRYAIDAAIVRIMKELESFGLSTANLGPDIKAIKKRIEDLISQEYLEREKENPNMFRGVEGYAGPVRKV